jgi:hypothetical protein
LFSVAHACSNLLTPSRPKAILVLSLQSYSYPVLPAPFCLLCSTCPVWLSCLSFMGCSFLAVLSSCPSCCLALAVCRGSYFLLIWFCMSHSRRSLWQSCSVCPILCSGSGCPLLAVLPRLSSQTFCSECPPFQSCFVFPDLTVL